MRSLNAATISSATPYTLRIANHMLGFRIIFHTADHTRLLIAFTGLPFQADDVLLAIVIMQNGRVETGRCQIYRLTPRTFNALRLNQIIIHVEIACIHGIHNAVNHVEHVLFLTIREAWSPNALSAWQLGEVRIRIISKHVGEQLPMLHILRMVNRNARKPFEGGDGHVVVVAFAADGRIGIEAFEDRIMQHCRSLMFLISRVALYDSCVRRNHFWTGNQFWAMQRPRSHASQPIQPGVLTVSVSSL